MGIFRNILSKIFGSEDAVAQQHDAIPSSGNVAEKIEPMSQVDVTAKLESLAAQSKEKLNWKTSIVDLMKLLGIESSLAARKELAKELNYTGDTNDSATMNIWLHKQVLRKIAENGGNVPADLLD